MKRVAALLLGILVVVMAATSPTSNAQAQAEVGRVRVVHASPDTPAVDIFVDGQRAAAGLAFPNNTGYLALASGPHDVKVFVSPADGSGSPALQATLTVERGRDYTVLAIGRSGDGSLRLLPLVDDNSTPAGGKAHVRFIHASPDAPAVDIVVRGASSPVFSNVAFGDASGYVPVDAGTYDFDVVVSGTSTIALQLNGVRLDARAVYTVIAVGLVGDGTLQALPLVDAVAPAAPRTGTGLADSNRYGSSKPMAVSVVVAGSAVLLISAVVGWRRRKSKVSEMG